LTLRIRRGVVLATVGFDSPAREREEAASLNPYHEPRQHPTVAVVEALVAAGNVAEGVGDEEGRTSAQDDAVDWRCRHGPPPCPSHGSRPMPLPAPRRKAMPIASPR